MRHQFGKYYCYKNMRNLEDPRSELCKKVEEWLNEKRIHIPDFMEIEWDEYETTSKNTYPNEKIVSIVFKDNSNRTKNDLKEFICESIMKDYVENSSYINDTGGKIDEEHPFKCIRVYRDIRFIGLKEVN